MIRNISKNEAIFVGPHIIVTMVTEGLIEWVGTMVTEGLHHNSDSVMMQLDY